MTKIKDLKKEKTNSIWDENIDLDKVQKLNNRDKHRLFPNDYAPNGEPYGDY